MENISNLTVKFTPQYGDSFLEKMRLLLLLDMRSILGQTMEKVRSTDWRQIVMRCVQELTVQANTSSATRLSSENCEYLKELQLQCTNADPNYGVLWFYCKLNPFDSARIVLASAKRMLQYELHNQTVAAVYFHAILLKLLKQQRVLRYANYNVPEVFPPSSCKADDFTTGLISANRPTALTAKLLFGADEMRA